MDVYSLIAGSYTGDVSSIAILYIVIKSSLFVMGGRF